MHIDAKDYRDKLDISGYLPCESGFLRKGFSILLTKGTLA